MFARRRTPPAASSRSTVSTPRLSARASGFPRSKLQGVTIENVAPGQRRIIIQGAPAIRKNHAKPASKPPRSKIKATR